MAARWEVGVDRTYLFRRYERKQNKREEKNIRIGVAKQEIGVRNLLNIPSFLFRLLHVFLTISSEQTSSRNYVCMCV